MKVITAPKKEEQILEALEHYGRVYVIGCGTCPTAIETGGIEQVEEISKMLTDAGKLVTGSAILNAVCDTPLALFKQTAGKQVEEAQVIVVLSCGLGIQKVAGYGLKPVFPALDSLFFGVETEEGTYEELCLQCGQCILYYTGGICPVTSCHKGILNGPCGGMNEGMCEVGDGRKCAWHLIYERLKEVGMLKLMKRYNEPRNFNAHLKPGILLLNKTTEKQTKGE